MDTNYDPANAVWDSDKTIFRDITLLITGYPTYIEANPYKFDGTIGYPIISENGYQTFTLLVSDRNLNPLIAGTSIKITSDNGTLSGELDYTFPGLFIWGPKELSFSLADSTIGDTDSPEPTTITIKVKYKGVDYIRTISGLID